MKKIINFLNEYLINFWFTTLFLMIGGVLVVCFSPLPEIITLSENGVLPAITLALWRFLTIFFLPLSIISITIFLLNHFKDKVTNRNNVIALVITLISLTTMFLLIIKLQNLDTDIKSGSLTIPIIGGPTILDANK